MFGGKSPATFINKFFEKGKEEEDGEEEVGDSSSSDGVNNNSNEYQGRKRSQSMFAPSVSALLSGDHTGARGIELV